MSKSLTHIAAGIGAVALALYVAARVIRDALPELVGVGVFLLATLTGMAIVRYRRSRW